MIDDMLIVEYDPFAMESRISICKDGKRSYASAHSSVDDLASAILALAYQNDLYTVKVHGPFGVERKLNELVSTLENTTYSANKIDIGGLPL